MTNSFIDGLVQFAAVMLGAPGRLSNKYGNDGALFPPSFEVELEWEANTTLCIKFDNRIVKLDSHIWAKDRFNQPFVEGLTRIVTRLLFDKDYREPDHPRNDATFCGLMDSLMVMKETAQVPSLIFAERLCDLGHFAWADVVSELITVTPFDFGRRLVGQMIFSEVYPLKDWEENPIGSEIRCNLVLGQTFDQLTNHLLYTYEIATHSALSPSLIWSERRAYIEYRQWMLRRDYLKRWPFFLPF